MRKYLPERSNILELGASIGVVASVCFNLKHASRLLLVESNPELIPLIDKNLILNRVKNATILNKAVTSIATSFWFNPGKDTVSGSISPTKTSDKASIVEGVQLSDLIQQEKLDDFVLISDIEGSEISFILGNAEVLKKCKMIIIELHRVVYEGIEYSVDDMIDRLIKNHRFTQIDRYGSVVAFTRSPN
ncbi:MAG: FkbM family methyltransferase [Cytophagales bacterium]